MKKLICEDEGLQVFVVDEPGCEPQVEFHKDGKCVTMPWDAVMKMYDEWISFTNECERN